MVTASQIGDGELWNYIYREPMELLATKFYKVSRDYFDETSQYWRNLPGVFLAPRVAFAQTISDFCAVVSTGAALSGWLRIVQHSFSIDFWFHQS